MASQKRTRTSVNVRIPADKDRIQEGEFISRTDIHSVDVSPNVREIMKGAFKDCTNLRTVRFTKPSLLQVIHEEAFAGCESLRSIEIQPTVELIKKSAFKGCGALQNIVFKPKDPLLETKPLSIEESAFDKKVGPTWVAKLGFMNIVSVPARAVKIGPYAFRGWPDVRFFYDVNMHDFDKKAFDGFNAVKAQISRLKRANRVRLLIIITMDRGRFLGTIQVGNFPLVYITRRAGREDSWISYKKGTHARIFRDVLKQQQIIGVIDQTPPGLGAIQSPKPTPMYKQAKNWDIETIPAGTEFQRISTRATLWRDMTFFTMGKLQPHFVRELLDSKGLGKDPLTNPHIVFTFVNTERIRILRINVRRRDVLRAQFPNAELFEKQLEETCKLKKCRGWVGFSPGDNRYVLPDPNFPRPKMLIHNIQWECALRNVPPLLRSFKIVKEESYDDVVKGWIAHGDVRAQRWVPLLMKNGPTLKF